ncbi:uncharacterized protein TNCV_4299671 [Trichonephila clavipes]|nr:uncharacterized protein TNCV_4299671 [Trichonephila clavipes]
MGQRRGKNFEKAALVGLGPFDLLPVGHRWLGAHCKFSDALSSPNPLSHDHRNPHDPGNYTNDWLDQSAASYMLAGYSPQSFLIYFSDMGWRLASRAICPENVTVVTLEVSEDLRIAQSVISRLWQPFQDDGNESRCYSRGRPQVTTPNEDRYIYIWQLLPKETDGAQHQTCLVSSLQLPVRQFQGRPCTDA